MWILKRFQDLSTSELFHIYQERVNVFVVEQECPYQEVDDKDLVSLHLFALQDDNITAYCRLIPEQDQLILGRVLVAKDYRADGLGRELVQEALKVAKTHFPHLSIYAQAQAYLEKFYQSFGFVSVSQPYLEDGISHIDMHLNREP